METILYILEVLKYQKLYNMIFTKKINKLWISFAIGIFLSIVFLLLYPNLDSSGKRVYAYIGTLGAMLFMMQGNWKQRCSELFVLFLLLNVMARVSSVPFRLFELYSGVESFYIEGFDSLVSSVLTLLAFYVVELWRKRYALQRKWNLNSGKIYILVLLLVIEMLITVTGLNYAEKYVSNVKFSLFSIILCTTSYIAIGMLGVFVIHIRKVNSRMEEMLQSETQLKEMQRCYYETLLEKEEDTRSYRHDMTNHLLCLNSFAQEQKIEELKDYLQKMQQQLEQIQRRCYTTGNQVLDAITNYYLSALEDRVEVQVLGFVNETLAVDNMTLCTIYANLLQNAIEELARVETSRKILLIEFLQGMQYFQITIRNSLSQKSQKKKEILNTGKNDKRNHGIGLKNVKKILKECGGIFEIEHNAEVFTAKVVLKYENSDRLIS